MDTVGLVRHARRHARLSQRGLAARAGISQSRLARIESGEVDPPLGLLARLIGLCGPRLSAQLVLAAGASPDPRRGPETIEAAAARPVAAERAGRLVAYLQRPLIERLVATLADRERAGRPLAGVASVDLRRGLVQLGGFQPTVVVLGAVAASCWDPDPPRPNRPLWAGGPGCGGRPADPVPPTRRRHRRAAPAGRRGGHRTDRHHPAAAAVRRDRSGRGPHPVRPAAARPTTRRHRRLPRPGPGRRPAAHRRRSTRLLRAPAGGHPEQLARAGQLPAARADEITTAWAAVAPRDRANRRQPPHRDSNEHRRWQHSFAPAAIAAALVRTGRLDWRADRPSPPPQPTPLTADSAPTRPGVQPRHPDRRQDGRQQTGEWSQQGTRRGARSNAPRDAWRSKRAERRQERRQRRQEGGVDGPERQSVPDRADRSSGRGRMVPDRRAARVATWPGRACSTRRAARPRRP